MCAFGASQIAGHVLCWFMSDGTERDRSYKAEATDSVHVSTAPLREYADFVTVLVENFWVFRQMHFADRPRLFDDHQPALFHWRNGEDRDPCLIYAPYQLVRNVIAACVRPSGQAAPAAGHAVLLCDARNPHFAPGGDIYKAYLSAREALKYPSLIRLCTWQEVTETIGNDLEMAWLAQALRDKYGLGEAAHYRSLAQIHGP